MFPELTVPFDPGVHVANRRAVELEYVLTTSRFFADEASAGEHAEVPGDGLAGHAAAGRQRRDREATLGAEALQEPQARRVAEGRSDRRDSWNANRGRSPGVCRGRGSGSAGPSPVPTYGLSVVQAAPWITPSLPFPLESVAVVPVYSSKCQSAIVSASGVKTVSGVKGAV